MLMQLVKLWLWQVLVAKQLVDMLMHVHDGLAVGGVDFLDVPVQLT